jgi:DNA adenine methylase
MPRPFIKWVGGKSQLLRELVKYVPKFDTYYEPFVGGGALFFCLRPEKALLSDSNGELINAFQVVRNHVESLIGFLSEYPNDKEFFLNLRAQNPLELGPILRAARFIYLNKTCFNGLYRVNKRNQFNSPFGYYKNPNICDKGVLRGASKVLQGSVDLAATYFEVACQKPVKGDFVYLDPPYLPISDTSFTNYSKKGFTLENHETLAKTFEELDKRGVKVLESNSDHPWIRDRYKNYEIIEVQGRRSVNSKGTGRGKVGELFIKNY